MRGPKVAPVIALMLAAAPLFAAEAPARLRYEPQRVLEAVARQMGVQLRPEIAAPAVRMASRTPLKYFQDAVEPQWGFRPHTFTNAYVPRTNEIFLLDDAEYYRRMGRFVDDSLAHEYAHFIQSLYHGADLADDSLELQAVAIQSWFRATYMKPLPSPRPYLWK